MDEAGDMLLTSAMTSSGDEARLRRALLHMLEDLQREQRRAREAHHQWIDTVDAIGEPLMVHDADGRIVRANKAYAKLAGLSFPEIIGRNYWECFPRCGGSMTGCLTPEGRPAHAETKEEFAVSSGQIYTSKTFALSREGATGAQCLHLFENVTTQRAEQAAHQARARRAIAQSEALSRLSMSGALQAGDVQALAREITELASGACDVARVNVWLFNEQETELSCIDHYDAAARSHTSGAVLSQAQFDNEFRALRSASYVAADDPLTDPRTAGYAESYLKPNRITSMLDAVVSVSGKHLGLLCLEHVDRPHHWEEDEIAFAQRLAEKVSIAISSRRARKAEAAMSASQRRLELATRSARMGIWDWDIAHDTLVWDAQMYRLYGVREQEFSGAYDAWHSGLHPEDRERAHAEVAAAVTGGRDFNTEFRIVWPNGEVRHIEAHAVVERAQDSTATRMIGANWDITERKRAAEEQSFTSAVLATQQEASLDGIYVVDKNQKMISFNRRFMEMWNIPAEVLATKSDEEALKAVLDNFESPEQFLAVVRDIYRDPMLKVHDELRLKGNRTFERYSSPMIGANGKNYGRVFYFRDISERTRAEESLREALVATVTAIAATVETRDPYTAGHQHRVADLASAIALEMGLPQELAQGIHFGAQLHDLGKVQVPAELLAKPTRLSKVELELIKTHPQAGYEIVKDIKFPWRVAEIVHQHHERLDGSGYPQGLKGDAIALEARIVAVADVVEAMASHRPYRPGLGIDVALKEIEDKRGRWFDPAAVDACVRLFRQKGYRL